MSAFDILGPKDLWYAADFSQLNKEGAKMVKKPWGLEVWLYEPTKEEMQTGRGYCYKRIYLNQGNQTSLQYHEKKFETNYIIEGEAEVWMQDPKGTTQIEIEGKTYNFSVNVRGANYFWNVVPPTVHRIKALTNIILQETSNPFVDDVIRLQDDANRGSGKIESEHLKK